MEFWETEMEHLNFFNFGRKKLEITHTFYQRIILQHLNSNSYHRSPCIQSISHNYILYIDYIPSKQTQIQSDYKKGLKGN